MLVKLIIYQIQYLYVIFVLTLFVAGIFGININSLIGIILFFVGLLSLPSSMSVYLARDIATTNKNLTLQLKNVKELSKKELEQQLRAQKAEAENERKSKELEEARQLQLSMLPKELPQLPNLDIAVYMKKKNKQQHWQGFDRNLTAYGDEGFSRYIRGAFLQSTGYDKVDINRPVIGIADTPATGDDD